MWADDDGRFTFDEIDTQSYRVRARAGARVGESRALTVVAPQPMDGVVVEVGPAAAVRGVVRDAGGRGAAGKRVLLMVEGPGVRSPDGEARTVSLTVESRAAALSAGVK
jgi:hypothetical protein